MGKEGTLCGDTTFWQILQELSYQQAREQASGTRSLELEAAQEQFQKWHLSASLSEFPNYKEHFGIPQETIHLPHDVPPINVDEVLYLSLAAQPLDTAVTDLHS